MYRVVQGNQNSSGLQCVVAYWLALAVGSAEQLAAHTRTIVEMSCKIG